ncbi:MAG: hypothetical protein A2600_07930 [Candidatus Lambdaproteobacteria bacterium RIFOXYD1_FULL_56_27]|uniref:Uncharacterized protein n=1 Tax=Candidatus Lambdaproteobacteria bacterium RIFOXYD2_FULL_56_26 TaxID=1817773 RepID=A0A1F6GUW4_9PROT|nr:MAG: hypothetical protein A2426_11950 [Candidatus Lambdaproteobacteria bacterium RIFOXYC1_FULL_56_13]OGH01800.1 MAG: hypothetical protein A2557_01780 [Candidatus Lambdaproteobacteria bacterium RIFOXYD2_FULL_56_26]OGH07512.1 MAG: hypothetical protein A2600_07930 [Candidatus Lambdaproteobacteria bacterium RIFOXYD1_FULL_56_27]
MNGNWIEYSKDTLNYLNAFKAPPFQNEYKNLGEVKWYIIDDILQTQGLPIWYYIKENKDGSRSISASREFFGLAFHAGDDPGILHMMLPGNPSIIQDLPGYEKYNSAISKWASFFVLPLSEVPEKASVQEKLELMASYAQYMATRLDTPPLHAMLSFLGIPDEWVEEQLSQINRTFHRDS